MYKNAKKIRIFNQIRSKCLKYVSDKDTMPHLQLSHERSPTMVQNFSETVFQRPKYIEFFTAHHQRTNRIYDYFSFVNVSKRLVVVYQFLSCIFFLVAKSNITIQIPMLVAISVQLPKNLRSFHIQFFRYYK